MVHARHFLGGGTSVVLFGPTDERFYGYPENVNLSRRFCPFACELIDDDWIQLALTAAMLELQNIRATCCQQPDELIEQLRTSSYEVLLSEGRHSKI